MKRLLLIAYDFPPRGGTGVFRVMKFARYLPEWGWEPVVITVDGSGPHPDPQLLAELPPGLDVLRVRAPGTRQATPVAPLIWPGEGRSPRWRTKLKPWIVPDPQIVWVPQAIMTAYLRIRRGDISAIMTSGPPFSTHLIGWWLKRWYTHIPWLMDMRDLWSEGLGQSAILSYKLNRMLEQQCGHLADHITVVTKDMGALMCRRLQLDPECISTITNGFDPDDYEFLSSAAQRPHAAVAGASVGPLTIRYVGTLAEAQAVAAKGFFAALHGLQDEGIDRHQLQVQLIGTFGQSLRDWAAPLVDAGIVEFLPFMPHASAMEWMSSADILLFMLRGDWVGRIAHGNKLFEYLALGRPILAIAPQGEATRLIAAEQAGLSASPDDVPSIIDVLRHFLAGKATGELGSRRPEPERLRRFHRRELAGQLAHLLNTMQSRAPVGSGDREGCA